MGSRPAATVETLLMEEGGSDLADIRTESFRSVRYQLTRAEDRARGKVTVVRSLDRLEPQAEKDESYQAKTSSGVAADLSLKKLY